MRSKKGGGDHGSAMECAGGLTAKGVLGGWCVAGRRFAHRPGVPVHGREDVGALRAECSKGAPLDGGGWGDGCGDRKGVGGTLASVVSIAIGPGAGDAVWLAKRGNLLQSTSPATLRCPRPLSALRAEYKSLRANSPRATSWAT